MHISRFRTLPNEPGHRTIDPGPLSCPCATHRCVVFGQDFILEGRREARGQASEASADLLDFHQVQFLT